MLPPDVANKIRSLLDTLDPLDLTDIANTCSGNALQFRRGDKDAYHSPDGLPAAAFETNCDFVVELGGPAMPSVCPVHRERHQSASLAAKGLLELCQIHGYCLQPNLVNACRLS
uniref:F-box domain-containing protein n=1 Tax=Macrostomum lignano TaxID=282301 RepID=A0A1I8F3R5_9PLAT